MVSSGEEGSSGRPKLSYLRSLTKSRPPPAVVITDDSEAFPAGGGGGGGGINPAVLDALFARPFVGSSASDVYGGSPGSGGDFLSKLNGMCSGSPLKRDRSLSREGSLPTGLGDVEHHTASFDNTVEAEGTTNGQIRVAKPKSRCCSAPHRRAVAGVFLTIIVAGSWVGSAHLLKLTYLAQDPSRAMYRNGSGSTIGGMVTGSGGGTPAGGGTGRGEEAVVVGDQAHHHPVSWVPTKTYNAPFFTTWFCTLWNSLFFPVYLFSSVCSAKEKTSAKKLFVESIQQFQEKGFSALQFFGRCGFFSMLWVATNYMFVHSLRLLDTTYVVVLYASNVSFVYLLSWVVLHEQFVGIRIVAVILSNTGIALLAYMDGVTRSATLGGVVLAAAAAAGSAVYKVFFKKLVGEVSFGQLSLFFTLVGLLNILLLWPLVLTLYFSNAELILWDRLPWPALGGAALLSLVANLLGNFGVIWTYEVFLTLGLVLAVPASAAIDVYIYGVRFIGMKLAGIILVGVGFFLVLLPQDWPDYLKLLLRWRRKKAVPQVQHPETGYRSRLRTPSGQVK